MLGKAPSEARGQFAQSLARDLAQSLERSLASQTGSPEFDWSLGTGGLGVALALEWMDRAFPSECWDMSAKRWLDVSVRCIAASASGHFHRGLYGGIAGGVFVTDQMSRGAVRYRNLSQRLGSYFVRGLRNDRSLFSDVSRVRAEDYDLISGPAGLIAVLDVVDDSNGKEGILTAIVASLISRIERCGVEGCFFLDPALSRSASLQELFPNGYIDCGLAHGVPGILAALAWYRLKSRYAGGIDAAINVLADWLLSCRMPYLKGAQWPCAVDSNGIGQPSRLAWCYGNPGVSWALLVAGTATGRDDLRNAASQGFMSTLPQHAATWDIDSPIVCHGTAGLVQIGLRFANWPGALVDIADLAPLIDIFLDQVAAWREEFAAAEVESRETPEAGFLEGSAGLILTLLSIANKTDPSWDKAMLLS